MYKNDIGILFDVSGSMQQPFNSFNFKYSNAKANEILNILERICSRGNNSKNEKIRVFSVLFGGRNQLIYDFCNLIEITNNTFYHVLESNDYSKAQEYGYGKKIEEVLSDNGNRTLNLKKYLYCDEGPTEKLCEMGYYLLKDDPYLCRRIYEKLPSECKSNLKDLGIFFVQNFSYVQDKINRGTREIINDIYETCINEYTYKIINKEISQRNSNGNQLKFLDGNDLINMQKSLEKKIISPNKSNFNLIDLFSNFIYGNTPLYTALNISFDNFKKQSDNNSNKYLFIISDGELNDIQKNFDYIGEIRKNATNNNIIIISIFLTSQGIPKTETFYDEVQPHFTGGAKDLFLMSSNLNYENPIIKFFIKKGWDIPISGECRLFIEINNSQNLDKFIELMNEAISELNYKNSKKIENSFMNLLASTIIDHNANLEINKFKAEDQKDLKTCYANAIATIICFASSRIYSKEKKKLEFIKIRDRIQNKYGINGAHMITVLIEIIGEYRLRYEFKDEKDAKIAIINTRPCLAVFKLTKTQWQNFRDFFKLNPKGILTKEIINKQKGYDEDGESHCVILTHISKKYLKFLNSWGTGWGDNGYFKVENNDVLNADFIEIYWELKDLNQNEKDDFMNRMEELRTNINDYLFN